MTKRFFLLLFLAFSVIACEEDEQPTAPDDGGPKTGGGDAYEVKYESGTSSGWYGGDNRAAFGPRTVGVGCSVPIDEDIVLDSFSFRFSTRFDYPENPDNAGHDVTLTLNIRNSGGSILKSVQVNLPASYTGGWATWTGINLNVDAGTTLIFTTYLVGAYDTNEYYTGHECDGAAGYTGGQRWTKNGTSDADMEAWTGWSVHPWDAKFWLQGTTR